MKLSSLLAPLIARNADHGTIMDLVLAYEAEQLDGLNKRRENDAKRQAEKRKRDDSHVTSRDVTVTVPSHASASPAPDLENKQTNKEERKQDTAPVAREFEESFWPAYPLKRGKADALKAFLAARKRASLEIIMAGVRRYAAERAGEDPKFTKHAQGWLGGDHWTDEPAPPRPARQAHAPPETVGSLSLKQLLNPRNETDVADHPTGHLETSGPRRLEASAGASKAFTVTGDFLGRI